METAAAARPLTYGALFAVPGFRRLAGATLLARSATAMQSLVLVLFVLQRFHSPPLAGLVMFLSLFPGIVISPIAGALLDRHRRMLLITLDFAVAALSLVAIVALDHLGRLPAVALMLVVAAGSLTNPLSNSGTRSLFPVMVPRGLWERANAVDSGLYVVAAIAGPALAGVVVGLAGAEAALLATAALFAASLASLLGMTEPALDRVATSSLLRDAFAGLRYVLGNRALRGLAVTTAVSNVGFGTISVAMPVLLLTRYGSGPAAVGAMWAVMGVTGVIAGALAGSLDSEGREVWFIAVGAAISVVAMGCMLVAATLGGGVPMVATGMAVFGIANGPFDIGLFSLRQRATAPAWMGRAFAVSMSLNFVGLPVGSALAGPIVEHSAAAAFALALTASALGGVAALAFLRPVRQHRVTGPEYN